MSLDPGGVEKRPSLALVLISGLLRSDSLPVWAESGLSWELLRAVENVWTEQCLPQELQRDVEKPFSFCLGRESPPPRTAADCLRGGASLVETGVGSVAVFLIFPVCSFLLSSFPICCFLICSSLA